MRRLATTLAAAALVLAACGGGGSFDSAEDAAQTIGCDSIEESEVFGASDVVTCDLNGDSLRISRFDSDEEKSGYQSIADVGLESGLAEGEILYGGNVAVECNSSCDDVREAIDVD